MILRRERNKDRQVCDFQLQVKRSNTQIDCILRGLILQLSDLQRFKNNYFFAKFI